jgi:hypothetical protein
MGIWWEKCSLTTEWKVNQVRKHVCTIGPSIRISNELDTNPKQWDILPNCCITSYSILATNRPIRKAYITDKTIQDSQYLEAAHVQFAMNGLCGRHNEINETPTNKNQFVHFRMYSITPTLLCSSCWCVHSDDDKEETTGHKSLPIKV